MTYHDFRTAMIGLSLLLVCSGLPEQAGAQVDVSVGGVQVRIGGPPPPVQQVEVLTRGPIHEAFAQPVTLERETPYTITHRPPAPLAEAIPDEKPLGRDIAWIPGYWSWDMDRNDFIWVSGCWRAVPPNTSWVPGYWAQAQGGYQWISGFWTNDAVNEIAYLPAPPATLEAGPIGTGTPDSVWIPGSWVLYGDRYAWRPGFWAQARRDWIWVPAEYTYTPRGWVHVDGYWDYPLDRRGVAFLPVYFPTGMRGQSFQYSPEIVLDLAILTGNLFTSPRRHHYYFGDYYGTEYYRDGYYPWYEANDHHDRYDPIYVHERWQHRDNPRWVEDQRTTYSRRRDQQQLRPARTYDAMRTQSARLPEADRRQTRIARPMREVVSDRNTSVKYTRLDTPSRQATDSRAREVHTYADKRAQWESHSEASRTQVVAPRERSTTTLAPLWWSQARGRSSGRDQSPARQEVQPQKVRIPQPPIVARRPEQADKSASPPRLNYPKPDPNARPKPTQGAPERSKGNDHSERGKSRRQGQIGRQGQVGRQGQIGQGQNRFDEKVTRVPFISMRMAHCGGREAAADSPAMDGTFHEATRDVAVSRRGGSDGGQGRIDHGSMHSDDRRTGLPGPEPAGGGGPDLPAGVLRPAGPVGEVRGRTRRQVPMAW